MKLSEIKIFLEEKSNLYNQPKFIETDPIQIPKNFTRKEDIEISAFITSIISWGKRSTIIKNAWHLMQLMEYSPYDFVMKASPTDKAPLKDFKHRTFNGNDCLYLLDSLKNIYKNYNRLQS